jgi:glutamate formiminotransferase
VGAREILVAWNIWLRDTTVRRTKEIAASLRREGLRTLGLAFGDYTQVSCNLTDVSVVTPSAVLDATRAALRDNENVVRCELVGLAPASLVAREPADRLDELDLSWKTTIENFLP